jgi:hypothetical protein
MALTLGLQNVPPKILIDGLIVKDKVDIIKKI